LTIFDVFLTFFTSTANNDQKGSFRLQNTQNADFCLFPLYKLVI
jgi:hypothetical protein